MTNRTADDACRDLAKRVAPMYRATNWKWQRKPVTEPMLCECAKDLIKDLLREKPLTKGGKGITSMSTGGLEARRYLDEEKTVCYDISFRVTKHISGTLG